MQNLFEGLEKHYTESAIDFESPELVSLRLSCSEAQASSQESFIPTRSRLPRKRSLKKGSVKRERQSSGEGSPCRDHQDYHLNYRESQVDQSPSVGRTTSSWNSPPVDRLARQAAKKQRHHALASLSSVPAVKRIEYAQYEGACSSSPPQDRRLPGTCYPGQLLPCSQPGRRTQAVSSTTGSGRGQRINVKQEPNSPQRKRKKGNNSGI